MKIINEIEALTIRKGKLVLVPIADETKPLMNWNWCDNSPFGIGTRSYTYQSADLGYFHEINIKHENVWKASLRKKPRTIKGDFVPNQYLGKRSSLRVIHVNCTFDLNKIYRLYFEDQLTGKRFAVSNYDILDVVQPGMECQAYWAFNPYAVFGTGFKSWANPNWVFAHDLDMKYIVEKRNDPTMTTEVHNRKENMENLTSYTGINF